MFTKSRLFVVCLAASALGTPTLAQQRVYPVKKQSPEQQKQDEARCFTWAMQQTGFDPAKPWLASQASALPTTGGSTVRFRSGAAGAATGTMTHRDAGDAAVAGAIMVAPVQPAAGGATSAITRREAKAAVAGADGAASAQPATGAAAAAILGHDAGNVIAGGATAGATVRRDANPKIILQREQAVSQEQLAGQASFEKARTACLEARGYSASERISSRH